jgi:quinol monooxygenase YgiN
MNLVPRALVYWHSRKGEPMAVIRISHFEAKRDTAPQLNAFMQDVVRKVQKLPGCQSVQLLRSTEDPRQFAIVEAWDSIEAHQRAATTIPPDQLERAKQLVARPPVGGYYQ